MRLFLTIIFSILFLGQPAMAMDPAQTITVDNAYAFATMPGGVTGAAFLTINNTGSEADTLIEVKSNIAEINEIHENMIDPDDGKMMMRKISSITVPAGGAVTLDPKGFHVMLIKLSEPLTLDSSFPLTLVFEKAGAASVNVSVIQPGTTPRTEEPAQMEMHGHNHAAEIKEDSDDGFPEKSFNGQDDVPEEIEHF